MKLSGDKKILFVILIFLIYGSFSPIAATNENSFPPIHGDLSLFFQQVSSSPAGLIGYQFIITSPYLTGGLKGERYVPENSSKSFSLPEKDKFFLSFSRPEGKEKIIVGNYTAGFGQGLIFNIHPHSPPGIDSDLTDYPSWKGGGFQWEADKFSFYLLGGEKSSDSQPLWGIALNWNLGSNQHIGFIAGQSGSSPLWGLNFAKEWDCLSLAGEIAAGDKRGLFLRAGFGFQKVEGTIVYRYQDFDNPLGYIEKKPGGYTAGTKEESFWLRFRIPISESFSIGTNFSQDYSFNEGETTFTRQWEGHWRSGRGLIISANYSSREKGEFAEETLIGEIEKEFLPFTISLAGKISTSPDWLWKGGLKYFSTSNLFLEYCFEYGVSFSEQKINLSLGKEENPWEIEYSCREGNNGFQQKFSTQISWEW